MSASITIWRGFGVTPRGSAHAKRRASRGNSVDTQRAQTGEGFGQSRTKERVGGLLAFLRKLRRSFDHFVQQFLELSQPRRRNDNGVAPPIHVLGNAQKTAAWILLERKDKSLALNLDLVGLPGILL